MPMDGHHAVKIAAATHLFGRSQPKILPTGGDRCRRQIAAEFQTGRHHIAGAVDQHEVRARQSARLAQDLIGKRKSRFLERAGDLAQLLLNVLLSPIGRQVSVQHADAG